MNNTVQIEMGGYVPLVHTGTREQIIHGLMDEASGIAISGYMRMHARCRELSRIERELASLGVTMLKGEEEDAGYLLAVDGHLSDCKIDIDNMCRCPVFYRVEGSY